MTSFLMSLVARTVATSGLAEDCQIDSRGTAHRTRATWTQREEGEDFDAIVLRSSIRIPFDDVGHELDVDDAVRIGGRTYRVARCWVRGPVLDVGLTEWRAR